MLKNHRMFWIKLSWILTAFIILGIPNIASATHFRGGQISWTIPNPVSAPLTVEFTITQNWRHSANGCENLNFGDSTFGSGCNSFVTIGTGTDVGGRVYSVNQHTETHTYASAGEFTASFQSCCRLSDLANGPDGSFKVQTVVALGNGNGGGPNVSLAAVNTLQIGDVRSIDIPAVDPDGDAVSCRFATDAETLISPSLPSINGISPTLSSVNNICTIEWDLSAVSVAGEVPYVMSLVFESERGGVKSTTQADTTVILSSSTVAVPVCAGSGSFPTPVGIPFTHKLTGTKAGESLTVSTIGAPNGSTLTPVSATSGTSPMEVFFRWTPTLADSSKTKAVIVRFSDSALAQGDCLLSLTVPMSDSDGDRLPDAWEISGTFEGLSLSEARFGGVNEPETSSISDFTGVPYAPDMNKKDVYLWIDALSPPKVPGLIYGENDEYSRLSDEAVLIVQRAFQLHGVNLHVNLNRVSSEALDDSGLSRDVSFENNTDLDDYREAFGFNSLVTANNEPVRASIYHYAVYGRQYFDPNNPTTLSRSSGLANATAMTVAGNITPSKATSQAGTLMHELGHILGLHHGGPLFELDGVTEKDLIDDVNLQDKPNYISIMNYLFQFPGLITSSQKYQVDYASFSIGDVNETTLLFENTPPTNNDTSKRWATDLLGGPIIPAEMTSLSYGTRVECKNSRLRPDNISIDNISDYRSNEADLANSFEQNISPGYSETCSNINNNDINNDGNFGVNISNPGEEEQFVGVGPDILRSYSDWDNLVYYRGGIGKGLGVTPGLPTPSLTPTASDFIKEAPADELYNTSEHEVSVNILDSDRKTTSPATLLQQFTVNNSGLKSDTYELTLLSYSQWVVAIVGGNELTLAPGESKTVTVSIEVPAGVADLHEDTVKLRAESTINTTFDSKEVVITVDATAPADSDGDGLSDADEAAAQTDPNIPDTDEDGFNDSVDPDPLVADTLAVNPFSILPKSGVTAQTTTASDTFTFTGPTQEVPISIVRGEYSIDGGTTFTHLPGMVEAGQSVVVRTVSSPSAGGEAGALVNIGGETALFKVVTFDPDTILSATLSIEKTTDPAEPSTNGKFTVRLSAENTTGAPIMGTIAYSGTAVSGTDYMSPPSSFSIANGASTDEIAIEVKDDSDVDPGETVIATITASESVPSTVSVDSANAAATATIGDDDTTGSNETMASIASFIHDNQVINSGSSINCGTAIVFTGERLCKVVLQTTGDTITLDTENPPLVIDNPSTTNNVLGRLKQFSWWNLLGMTNAYAIGFGDFMVNLTGTPPYTITTSSPQTFNIVFTPTAVGPRDGLLVVTFSDGSTFSFVISGTGTVATVTGNNPQNIPVFGPLGLLASLLGLFWLGRRRKH